MYRTHHCGALSLQNINETVTLSGWVQNNRDLGGLTFIDLRDRYGITQLTFNMETNPTLCMQARTLGREFVIQAKGIVKERESKNKNIPTGEIEVMVEELLVLNTALTPPFTIQDETDGGEELRMKYRYLDLRRPNLKHNILLRSRVLQATRNYLSSVGFNEIETPFLIKSTPEGARDFVVPSRLHADSFYALPQSPQIFKQLLMVSGFDKYFQIVKCFRDEDFRADRQPEFTQIDCEMSFIHQEDIIETFSGMVKHLFKEVIGVEFGEIPQITYAEAMKKYGSDKPDIRFGFEIQELNSLISTDVSFPPFQQTLAEGGLIAGISIQNGNQFTRKQLDEFTEFIKQPHLGLSGLIWVRNNEDGTVKSSVDKFFDEETLKTWLLHTQTNKGDILLIGAGKTSKVQKTLGALRLFIADKLGLKDAKKFAPLWVIDFPMFEEDEETGVFNFMHHPFTSPKPEDMHLLHTHKGLVKALAYDFVINGMECGGGSIRIHDSNIQAEVFKALGMSDEEAQDKFGFLLSALQYGAPPHGGIAFGFDRLCAIMVGTESIRDVMAFPKSNAGKDVMLDAPSPISDMQRKELGL